MLLLILAIVACGIGGIFMWKLWRERETGKESMNWPQTEGMVTQSDYQQRARRRDSYARISYRYIVAGKTYSSSQVNVAKDYVLIEPKAFVDKHPAGSKIPVYYNADRPEVSVVVPGVDEENKPILIIFGCMMLVLVTSLTVLLLRFFHRLFLGKAFSAHA